MCKNKEGKKVLFGNEEYEYTKNNNGEEYLKEQLNSLLNQTYKNIEILIRDDGSSDNTLEILKKYSESYDNISFYTGKNLKPAKSFLDLIKKAEKSKYYAFSDQDDVWDKDKIEIAIKMLEKEDDNLPKLYFSNTKLVDKNLNELKNIRKIYKDKLNIGNALIENVATGCTVVFNDKLIELLKKINFDDIENGFMHDSLAYRICFATGNVIFDEIPHISYRQHENNAIGNSSNIFDKIKKRKKSLKNTLNLRSKMSKFILERFNKELKKENYKFVEMIANYNNTTKNKLKLLFCKDINRMNFWDNIMFKLAIIAGKV